MDFSTIRLFRLPVAVKITLSLSIVMLGIGYLIAAFDDQKRTLHDHICDTRVIRLNA